MAQKIPAALMSVNCENCSIQINLSSASADKVHYGPTPIDALLPTYTGAGIDNTHHGQDRCSLLDDPCSCSRRMVEYLVREGIPISHYRVRNLMRHQCLTCDWPETPHHLARQAIRAISLSGEPQQVRTADQVWATDITYIQLQKVFLYLVAIVGLFSRNILTWKFTGSTDTEFCLHSMEMALSSGRKPEIFHSGQECQFNSSNFMARLQKRRSRSADQAENATTVITSREVMANPHIGGGVSACLQRWLGS